MRGATIYRGDVFLVLDISIHAPHAGGDDEDNHAAQHGGKFQSTPPMRGATA